MTPCTEEKKILIIVLEENNMKMIFHNKKRKIIKITTVDGCEITSGPRCDYLVKNDKDIEFFVELKGTDILHACKQLSISIVKLSQDAKNKSKFAFVVSSSVRPAIRTRIQTNQRKFKEEFNCLLLVKNQVIEFEL